MKLLLSGGIIMFLLYISLIIAAIVGEVKCFMKFIDCDFEPSYKAEVIYGVSFITGVGCIVGYLDIKDKPHQLVVPHENI